jgi:hypothetical protein
VAAVERANRTVHRQVHIDVAAHAEYDLFAARLMHRPVADDKGIGLQQFLVFFEDLFQIWRARLFLALEEEFDVDRRRDPPGETTTTSTTTSTTTTTTSITTTSSATTSTSTTSTTLPGDRDGDGIEDPVDGQILFPAFVDQSGIFSSSFTDQHLAGGTSFGSIVDRGGLVVRVANLPNPSGVLITAVGETGSARVSSCLIGPLLSLTGGDSAEVTCSSLVVQVLAGPIQILFPKGVVATVPAGATATVSELAGGRFEIENSPTSTGPIVVESGDVTRVLEPGEFLITRAPSGNVTLCHKGRQTKLVAPESLPGHLGHGDTVGACPK